MVRIAFVALAAGMLVSTNALEVVTPAMGDTVVGGRTYTVEWEGAGSGRFGIDLYYCGSLCSDDNCGYFTTTLTKYCDSTGCPDTEGDYDVVMPAPMQDIGSYGYTVVVSGVDDPDLTDCSDPFYLISEGGTDTDDADAYYLEVTSPTTGALAFAGDEYTVEWDYMNGAGSKVDRFSIDLYTAGCGAWVDSICDKPAIGCKDSEGDYDITIPESTEAGMYSIRVARFEDPNLYHCSEDFEVESIDTSYSFSF